MKRTHAAVSAEDVKRLDQLKALLPLKTPYGWVANGDGPTRMNSYDQPGIFLRTYSNGFLMVVYLATPDEVAISLSNRNPSPKALPTEDHIELVKKAFFPKTPGVSVSPPRDGLVYFILPG